MKNKEKEIWKWVVGMEGDFEISNMGRVRSYMKVGRYQTGRLIIPNIRKKCIDGRGYCNFFVNQNGKNKTLIVHREMAKAFLPNPNNYPLVRHLNDIKTDNRLSNLAWGTYLQNSKDADKNGKLFKISGTNITPKLTIDIVSEILLSSKNNTQLSKVYSVSESTIRRVRKGITWKKTTGL